MGAKAGTAKDDLNEVSRCISGLLTGHLNLQTNVRTPISMAHAVKGLGQEPQVLPVSPLPSGWLSTMTGAAQGPSAHRSPGTRRAVS